MASLLEIATEAIEGIDSFNAPSTIIGNDDATAVLLKNVATQVGREIVRESSWQALKTPYTFATVAGVSAYSLPVDYQRLASFTFWNTSEGRPLSGPLSATDWAAVTRGLLAYGFNYAFSVHNNYLNITPTPSSVQNIGYDYFSRYFCTTSLGVAIPNWAADGDLWRLDPDLAVLGMRYRFRARKGLPFAEEKADYDAAIAGLRYDDTPKRLIDISGVCRRYDNLPEGSFGGAGSSGGGSGGSPPTFDDDSSPPTFDSDT
jgi:hypothetical protein